MKKKIINSGFTLIEVMITVAIIGILASIAYPSYQQYVIKTNRTAAKSFLMDIMQKEQQYLLDARSYAYSLSDLSMNVPSEVSKYYGIQFDNSEATITPPIVTITAIPSGIQQNDGDLSISSTGEKTGKW